MRILHIAETIKGGIASYFDELVPNQIGHFGKDNVRLLVPDTQIAELSSVTRSVSTTFTPNSSFRAANIFLLSQRYRSLTREFRPNIIHIHSSFAGVACRITPSPKGTKLVYCAHGWSFSRDASALLTKVASVLERVLSRKSHAIICLSESDRAIAIRKGLPLERLHVIPNGIGDSPAETDQNTGAQLNWKENALRVLFVGRFDRQKGFDIFVQALKQLPTTHQAIAIGSPVVGKEEPAPLPENIDHIGWQPRHIVQQYFKSADVVVLPSRWEGAPITVLEAMRSGTAVIGTNVGAIPEQIVHRDSGLVIAPNNPKQLISALTEHSRAEFHSMGERARSRFNKLFSSDKMNSSTIALYTKLTKQR